MNNFSTESSDTSVEFSSEISLDEIKDLVTEKRKFECRHESKFLARFRNFWTIMILMQGPNPTSFQETDLPLVVGFQLTP